MIRKQPVQVDANCQLITILKFENTLAKIN
jgi:hypothetical protein